MQTPYFSLLRFSIVFLDVKDIVVEDKWNKNTVQDIDQNKTFCKAAFTMPRTGAKARVFLSVRPKLVGQI